MKYLLACFMFILASSARAQDCSGAAWGAVDVTPPLISCPSQGILNPPIVSFFQTQTALAKCFDHTNFDYVYASYDSEVAGYGVARCTYLVLICPPFLELAVTYATNPNDYNRFYNRAYDATYIDSVGCFASSTVGFHQDFFQCQGVDCGGGGTTDCGAPGTPQCPDGPSPIIIDVSGEGFFLTDAKDGVVFDIVGNGKPMRIAWTAPGARNAFLCLPDPDGKCDDGKDLFGNFTPQPHSATPNGFIALAVYDGNNDGVIDSRDAVFSSLRLWLDENHDGISQPDELRTLSSMGITSLSVKYQSDERRDQYGNRFRYRAQINGDDVGRFAYDVFLTTAVQAPVVACGKKLKDPAGL